ncbi:MAG: hypothetical protein QOD77_284 [Thermoplasmata archaeon]|jgi:hypothetical protein|nr:hypothetical protein [Thermoplasmata archaeon]
MSDFTRITHDATKHYTRVLRQQGRVDLDADWNEGMDIQAHELRTRTLDVVGAAGVPADAPGFGVTYQPTAGAPDFALSAGRLYVDGILATLEKPTTYTKQPDLQPAPLLAPAANARHLLYALLWERHVTAHVDDKLREPALDGLDTATRTRTMAQVRWMTAPEHCATASAEWDALTRPTGMGLHCRGAPATPAATPCDVQPRRGYHGGGNRLYRVEIHDAGLPYPFDHAQVEAVVATDVGGNTYQMADIGRPWQPGDALELFQSNGTASVLTAVQAVNGNQVKVEAQVNVSLDRARRVATYKWSRDNGSVVLAVTGFPDPVALPRAVSVARFGRDHVLGLRPGDWVEVVSDQTETARGPGTMAQVVKIHEGDLRIDLDRDVAHHAGQGSLRLRRWDDVQGLRPVRADADDTTTTFLELEDDVEVRFRSDGHAVRSGDWWAFTARRSGVAGDPGDVQDLHGAPPEGRVHVARLAIVEWGVQSGNAWTPILHDCRRRFLPLTELDSPCPATSVGDGTTSIGRHTHNADYPYGLQQAIDSLDAGMIHVLPGRYVLPDSLRLHSGITLQGCGDRSILVAPAGKPAVLAASVGEPITEVALETLRIEGAVRFERVEKARVQGCTVLGAGDPAIVARDARWLRVLDCRVDGSPALHFQAEDATVATSRVRGAIQVSRASSRVDVTRCVLHHADGHAVEVGGAPPAPGAGAVAVADAPPSRVRVHANLVRRAGKCAVWAAAAAGDGAHGLAIEDNRIQQCWAGGSAAPYLSAAVHVEHWARVSILGNEVTDNARTMAGDGTPGVRLVACEDVDLMGNHVAKNGAMGHAPALMAVGCERLHAAHNHLHGWGRIASKPDGAPARVAVVLHGRALRLHGNRVRGGAVQVLDGSSGVHVEANHVADGDGPGIHLGGGKAAKGDTKTVGKTPVEIPQVFSWPTFGGTKTNPAIPALGENAKKVPVRSRKVVAEEEQTPPAPSTRDVVVRHNQVEAMQGNGIEAVAATDGLVIEGNLVRDCVWVDPVVPGPASIFVAAAIGLRLAGNVVAGLGSKLGPHGRAGIHLEACQEAHSRDNRVHDPWTAFRANGCIGLDLQGEQLESMVLAFTARATGLRLAASALVGKLHVRDGSVRLVLEGNRVQGGVHLGGLIEGFDTLEHAFGVHDVRVAGNEIRDTQGPGLQTPAWVDGGPTGSVHGLTVEDNLVAGCVLSPGEGALQLLGVQGLRVHGNRIVGNPGAETWGGSVGILAHACLAVDLQRNEVAGSGGLAITGCLPSPGFAPSDDGPALVVQGNTVTAPAGPALVATGLGAASIRGNSLASLAPHPNDGHVGSCVDIQFPGSDPLRGLMLPTLSVPGRRLAVNHHLEHYTRTYDPASAFQGQPFMEARVPGRVQFSGNQVVQHATGATTAATVAIAAGTDLAFQDNQVHTRNPGGFTSAAVLAYAPDARLTGNAIEELPWGAAWSAAVMAHRPVLAANHLTHCHHPNKLSDAPAGALSINLVQVATRCGTQKSGPEHGQLLDTEKRLRAAWREAVRAAHAVAGRHAARLERSVAHLPQDALRGRLEAKRQAMADTEAVLAVAVDRCRWMAADPPASVDGWAIVGRVRHDAAPVGPVRIRLVRAIGGNEFATTGFEATVDANQDFRMEACGTRGSTYELEVRDGDDGLVHRTKLELAGDAGRRDVVELATR